VWAIQRREKRREPLSQPVYFIRGGRRIEQGWVNRELGAREQKRREEKKRKEIRPPPTSTSFAGGRKTGRARMVSLGPNEIPIEMSRGMGNREEIRWARERRGRGSQREKDRAQGSVPSTLSFYCRGEGSRISIVGRDGEVRWCSWDFSSGVVAADIAGCGEEGAERKVQAWSDARVVQSRIVRLWRWWIEEKRYRGRSRIS
jgi:hypothetical protein